MQRAASSKTPTAQRGLSLIELLVAMVVGLVVMAAAVSFFSRHLRESRAVQVELRLMQDLRSAIDLIGRDLRRAAYWGQASSGVWQPGAASTPTNPYAFVTIASEQVDFNFSRDGTENNALDTNEQFGFRLRGGVVEFMLGAANGSSNWQALTDANTVTITSFTVTPSVQRVSLEGMCATACSAADSAAAVCPPQQHLRSLNIALTGRSVSDAKVVRSLQSQVRLRNDAISGKCSA